MQPSATHVWHGLSVGPSITSVYPAKTAGPIEMLLGIWVQVCPGTTTTTTTTVLRPFVRDYPGESLPEG